MGSTRGEKNIQQTDTATYRLNRPSDGCRENEKLAVVYMRVGGFILYKIGKPYNFMFVQRGLCGPPVYLDSSEL